MVFWDIFRQKRQDKRTDEEKEQALQRTLESRARESEIRHLNHLLRKKEQELEIARLNAELSEFEGQDEADEDTLNPNALIQTLLANALLSNRQGLGVMNTPPVLAEPPHPDKILSDDEIRGSIKQIPKKYLKIGRGLPDEVLKTFIKKHAAVDDATTERALKIFREEFR